MKEKVFFLPAHAIRPNLAPKRGSCLASDMITVHGHPVGFMYREEPDNELDSGWRFFAGSESQEYCDDPPILNFSMSTRLPTATPTSCHFSTRTVAAVLRGRA